MDIASGRPTTPRAGDAIYLFCLGRASSLTAPEGTGVDEASVLDLVRVEDVVAVISSASRSDFCGPAAEEQMKDLAWVGPRVCRHEMVVEAAMRTSPVLPTRFGTLFSSRERLVSWLASHRATISGALDRFADHQEWAVKGTVNRSAAEAPLVALAMKRADPAGSPGARYLAQQRIRAGINEELNVWLKKVCEQIAPKLTQFAAEFRERPLSAAATEDSAMPVLNWALLVPDSQVPGFQVRLRRINQAYAKRGLGLVSSGPWPPYSFCPSLDADAVE